MTNTTSSDARTGYIAGLRQLADLLEADDRLSLPYNGTDSELSVFVKNLDEALTWRPALTNPRHRVDLGAHYKVRLTGRIAGLRVLVYIDDAAALIDPPVPVQTVVHPALTGEATETEVPA